MADSKGDKSKVFFWLSPEGRRDLTHLMGDVEYERRRKISQEALLEEIVTLCSKIPSGKFGEVEDFISGLCRPSEHPDSEPNKSRVMPTVPAPARPGVKLRRSRKTEGR